MSVLVIAEHDNKELKSSSLNCLTAAGKLDADIHLLVAGHQVSSVSEAAKNVSNVSKVLVADAEQYGQLTAENIALLVASIASAYTHILVAATTFGKNMLPRAAALCDMSQISDIISVESENTFIRPIYAGNALAMVQSSDAIKFITVRATAFDATAAVGGNAEVEAINESNDTKLSEVMSREIAAGDRPELTAAAAIISGGRGLGSKDKYHQLLEPLADKLGAALGASRAAVDAGFAPNDYQVGQTGKIVAPDLYFAIGISGAIQHLAGMQSSKVIVAINKDEDAPIFQVADYGLVGDLFEIIPELTEKL
ncbi:FAD-binding protein [uncultured Alteromonas sp.]|uniref:electron transfer flavoprotein subunit alpha/FixB family protein n=1 Tax=uncultured Alteromonas sp. TaxID=179113 RepID=UPI0030CFB7C8|tara:strand:- start:4928 stop:5860 length:933 start_codon:yes stop_codon:yes gene_type:complete